MRPTSRTGKPAAPSRNSIIGIFQSKNDHEFGFGFQYKMILKFR